MNKNLLISVMAKYGDTQSNLANLLGISLSRVNAKINENKAQFTQNEISEMVHHYNLSDTDTMEIFFAH